MVAGKSIIWILSAVSIIITGKYTTILIFFLPTIHKFSAPRNIFNILSILGYLVKYHRGLYVSIGMTGIQRSAVHRGGKWISEVVTSTAGVTLAQQVQR